MSSKRLRASHFKSLNINSVVTAQQILQDMAGHFGNDASAQPDNGFSEQALQVPASVLDFVEGAFNALPDAVKVALLKTIFAACDYL